MSIQPPSVAARRLALAGVCGIVAASASPASHADSQYTGTAYPRGDGVALYTETHWVDRGTQGTRHVVLYRCSDGTPFARKIITATPGDATSPDYRFEDARLQYREQVEREGAMLLIRTGSDAGQRTRRIPRRADGLVDAGFDAFVQRDFAALATGQSAQRPFLLADDARYLDVRIDDARPVRWRGVDAVSLDMRLDAWYGAIAPKVRLLYARQGAVLLEFEGIGTIRRNDGGALPVRIVFPPELRHAGVDRAAMRAAEVLPLSPRCSLQ